MVDRMLVMGLGYSGRAIAQAATRCGFVVSGTSRKTFTTRDNVEVIGFEDAGSHIRETTHLLTTIPPDESGDPVLIRYGDILASAKHLRWIGYVSTTGVYGDRKGGWVDETSSPSPTQRRSRVRRAAEESWEALASRAVALDIFRTGGIYGLGRSAFDDLRSGTARRLAKPGQVFSRIHRDDMALAITAAALRPPPQGTRILHLVDDEPAESAVVIEEAARLIGVSPPALVPFEEAAERMSPMARSFWEENRRVSSQRTKALLGISWKYPSFREGLRAILAQEQIQRPPE